MHKKQCKHDNKWNERRIIMQAKQKVAVEKLDNSALHTTTRTVVPRNNFNWAGNHYMTKRINHEVSNVLIYFNVIIW